MSNEIDLSKEKINVLVAYTSQNRYIGYEGDLPWKRDFKGDMKYVTKLIRLYPNTALVVGKTTYETIKRIKDVQILVVTSSEVAEGNAKSFKTLPEAIDFAKSSGMYVIAFGGSKIYEDAIRSYDCKLFCTVVEENSLKGDRTFPEVDARLENVSSKVDQFLVDKKVEKTWELKDNCFYENGYEYRFYVGYKI
ncbi:uncharacterized protein VICG_01184 [Vittaforma corneae ATCC 50505]|uniref:Dihydrofolate reductase n=1 Tax=Vittaforma corneae (strain ATCC 50505) TaxID=993615 RepID=L2GND9_VITCO|nr:uncharacterized protein VICG_01184 [Vittaforma corneae ATCC 50505]ELA41832.1 hypothetical protein VICG_01184 [Vittaforma corneae ATCC 50505]